MDQLKPIKTDLRRVASSEYAHNLQWFFKTGPGEYGEGDIFLGIRMPDLRRVAKRHRGLPLAEVERLLMSKYHEERMSALVIMDLQYQKADETGRKRLKAAYLRGLKAGYVNNWDLVDISAHKILGRWLVEHPEDRPLLDRLAASKSLWDRRVSVISQFALIAEDEYADAMRICENLVNDRHDLMHKAVGWMLREVGKRDRSIEERFLKKHHKRMPRTMLRYAIEKFPEKLRQDYLKGRA